MPGPKRKSTVAQAAVNDLERQKVAFEKRRQLEAVSSRFLETAPPHRCVALWELP